MDEAHSSLPLLSAGEYSPSPDDLFDALLMQRASLRRHQQITEW